jgi:hypothetical protein
MKDLTSSRVTPIMDPMAAASQPGTKLRPGPPSRFPAALLPKRKENAMTRSSLYLSAVVLTLFSLVLATACTPSAAPETPTPTPTLLPTATLTPSPTIADPTQPSPTAMPAPEEDATSTPTPTPTAEPGLTAPTPVTPEASVCRGLSGTLEAQLLVGPAEAVGLEPVAIGSIPFTVTGDASPYTVEGQAPITYQDTLVRDWGTYDVTMDTVNVVSGTCVDTADGGTLDLLVEMTGEQLVEVTAEGFHGEYPWSGTQTRDIVLPVENGATASGEGWAFVLNIP